MGAWSEPPNANTGFIPWRKVDLLLRAARSIWLATSRPDGRPHAVPVWFVWDGGSAYFISRRDLQKSRNLRRQSWAVLHLGDGDDVVILEGAAQVVADPAERDRIDQAYGEKYVDPVSGAKDTVNHDDVDLYRLDPVRVMAWEYGNIGTRTDWLLALPPR
jgi:PPOX class probable F420-dependent enzyme